MCLQCWSQLMCQALGCPPVPGLQWRGGEVTLVLSEIYWSAVPSPHHHHWPGHSAASSRLAPSGHSLHFTNHIGCIGNFSCICSTEFGFHCDTDMHWYGRPFDDLPESIFLSIWSICHCLFSPLLAALRHPLHHYQQIEWRHEVRLRIDNNINGNHIISRAMRTAAEWRWGSPGGGESTYQWGNMHIVHTHGE